jgi:anti-sigma factor ChrR (cupin superfamily)
MPGKNLSEMIETSRVAWKASKIEGVQYISLNTDPNDRQGTFLLKITKGGRYPKHRHPAGEEMYLLKGDAAVGGYQLKAGDFLYSPPNSVHDVTTVEGCVCLKILAKPLQIVPEGTLEEIESLPEVEAPPPAGDTQAPEPYEPSLRTIDLETEEPST